MEKKIDTNDIQVLNKVLEAALNIPGTKVDRTSFLEKELKNYGNTEQLQVAISKSPSSAGYAKKDIKRIANGCINYHTAIAATISFASGLPGGWFMLATVPLDLAQFYAQAIIVIQKLAYLYGWPDIFEEDGKVSDESLLEIALFLGVMSGVNMASGAIKTIAEKLANESVKRLPKMKLTKYGVYNVSKQVAKWLGEKMTKDSFARYVGKAIPIVGGIISGALTLGTFRPMAKKLRRHLEELPLANIHSGEIVINSTNEIVIE